MRIRITADLWNAKNCVAAGGKLMTGMVGEFVIVGEAADEQGYGLLCGTTSRPMI